MVTFVKKVYRFDASYSRFSWVDMAPPVPSIGTTQMQIVRKSERVVHRKMPFGSDFIYPDSKLSNTTSQFSKNELSKKIVIIRAPRYSLPEQTHAIPQLAKAKGLLPVQQVKRTTQQADTSVKHEIAASKEVRPQQILPRQQLTQQTNPQRSQFNVASQKTANPKECEEISDTGKNINNVGSKQVTGSSVKTVLPRSTQLIGTIQKFVPGFRRPLIKRVVLKPDSFSTQRTIPRPQAISEDGKTNVGRKFILSRKNSQEDIHMSKLTLKDVLLSSKRKNTHPSRKLIISKTPCEINGKRVFVRPKLINSNAASTLKRPNASTITAVPAKKPSENVESTYVNKERELLNLTEDEYKGVQGVPEARAYDENTLSVNNPTLARRLAAIMVNLKTVAAIEAGIVPHSVNKPTQYVNLPSMPWMPMNKMKKMDLGSAEVEELPIRVAGPVFVDMKAFEETNLNLGKLLNPECGSNNMINVVFNGKKAEIPEEIFCHLCGSQMRICMRKSKYRGELREYPAYRCLRKGCQTFRAIRKILDPGFLPKSNMPTQAIWTTTQEKITVENNFEEKNDVEQNVKKILESLLLDTSSPSPTTKPESSTTEVEVKQEVDDEEEDVEWSDFQFFKNLAEQSPAPFLKDEDNTSIDESIVKQDEEISETLNENHETVKTLESKTIREMDRNHESSDHFNGSEEHSVHNDNDEFGFMVEEQSCE